MSTINQRTFGYLLKYFYGILAFFFLGYLAYVFSNVIIILFISTLLAVLIDPLVTFLETKRIQRLYSTLIVFITIFVVFYFSLAHYIPKLFSQLDSLIQTLRNISLQEKISDFENGIRKYIPSLNQGFLVHKIETILISGLETLFYSIGKSFSGLFSLITLMVIVPFITFFIVKDKIALKNGIINILPNRYFEMIYWIFKRISEKLSKYVRGWIIDATFVGVSCGLGFSFIGIENSIVLGIIAGIGHLIPYLGPIIGGIPALLISVVQFGDMSAFPLIFVLLMLIYTVDNGFVQPYVFSKSVDMHPLIIILLIISGNELFGLLGMLLAVPTVSVLRTAIIEFYFAYKNYKITRLQS